MARKSSPKTRLVRSIESAAVPVYLLDGQFTVVFANQACADWIGVPLDDLIGKTLKYSALAPPESPRDRLSGLAPSPHALDADQVSLLARAKLEQGTVWRRGTLSRLADGGSETLLLVVLDAFDRPPPDADAPQGATAHDLLGVATAAYRQLYSLPGLVGSSSHAIRMRGQAEAAGQGGFNVLVSGPAGTGKEHLARVILNHRDPGALPVAVHCAVADNEMVQRRIREWAGHRQNDRSAAPLLLLDADRLKHDAQSELLGFLKIPDFPLTVVATSTQTLEDLVERELFDAELASRLSTMVIQTVALAQRVEDIPMLAQAVVESYNLEHAKQLAGLDADALEQLMVFPWTQNIDQLTAIVRQACQNATSPIIRREDLPEVVDLTIRALVTGQPIDLSIELTEFLETIERQVITQMLVHCHGNRSRAARMLGISRPRLLRRIEQLKIDVPSPVGKPKAVDVPIFEPVDEDPVHEEPDADEV